MQWLQLLFWGGLTCWAARRPRRVRWWRWVLCTGLLVSMATQLWLLQDAGILTLGTALPLHLCGIMAVLSIPMVLLRSQALFHFSMLLGVPGALLALCFPAMAPSHHPWLMALTFFRLHGLLLCCPLLLFLTGMRLPTRPQPVLLLANGYLLMVSLFNRLFGTNYLFLRVAPSGTPLEALAAQGSIVYICSLELLALLTVFFLAWGYEKAPALRG